MLAAVLDVPGEAPEVREYPDPVERPGHTLVSVTAAPL